MEVSLESLFDLDGYFVWIVITVVIAVSVYFYVFSSTPKPEVKPQPPPSPLVKPKIRKQNNKDTVKIFFGSQTGTAEEFSHKLSGEGKRFNFETEVIDLESYELEDLRHESCVIFIAATYGEGEPTDNARDFFCTVY